MQGLTNKIFFSFLITSFFQLAPLDAAIYTPHTNNDERFARELIELDRHIRNNRRNLRTLNSLNSLKAQAPLFDIFIPYVEKSNLVIRSHQNLSQFINHCGDQIDLSHNLVAQFHSNLQAFCIHHFLTHAPTNLNQEHFQFIQNNLPAILDRRFESELHGLLSRLKARGENHASYVQLSEILIDHIVNTSHHPSQQLVEHIKVNQRLTQHFQEIGYVDQRASRLFSQHFYHMIDQARELAQNDAASESIKKFDQALSFFVENNHYLSTHQAARRFRFLAQDLMRRGHFEYSKYVYGSALTHLDQAHREDLAFGLIWVDINRNNYEQAERNLHALNILEEIDQYGSRVQFWSAKVLQNRRKSRAAHDIFKSIVERNPLSYYAILATKELSQLNVAQNEINRFIASTISAPLNYINLNANDYSPEFKKTLGRMAVWSRLLMGHWAYSEAMALKAGDVSRHIINENIARTAPQESIKRQLVRDLSHFFNSKDDFLQTFRLKNQAVSNGLYTIADVDLEQLFPTSYYDDIKNHDENVDPVIILSLIRQESAFNPRAISGAGARGLMQLMPATARMLERGVRARDLENTDTNIRLGIQYFNNRLDQYDGNLIYTLAAYNAGHHRVARWQREVFQSDDPLKIIESIPFVETRNYVKLIYRNMFFYRLLKEEHNLNQSIADSFIVRQKTL